MAGMDLGGGYGAGGAVLGLQELLAQRTAARQYQDRQQQQQWENNYKQQQLAQADELKRAQLEQMAQASKDRTLSAQGQEQDRRIGLASSLSDQIPPQTLLAPSDPAVGLMQQGGRGSLLTKQASRPAVDVGPLQPGDTGGAQQEGFLKQASQKQSDTAAAAQAKQEAQQAAIDAKTESQRQAAADRINAIQVAAASRPAPDSGWSVREGTGPDGNPILMRVNAKNGETAPMDLPTGAGAGKVTPMIARQHQMATYANQDVDAAVKEVDAAEKMGLLGPGSGRVEGQFLAGFIGSTGDPAKDQQLGALKQSIKDLNLSYPAAITGSTRGGGNVNALKDTLNSDKFSAALLKGTLADMKKATDRRGVPSGGGGVVKWGRDANGNPVRQ